MRDNLYVSLVTDPIIIAMFVLFIFGLGFTLGSTMTHDNLVEEIALNEVRD